MRKILIFVPNYFPGYKSGGIARTILNTVDWLGDEFEFFIITRDRDLGADQPYEGIECGVWLDHGKSKVQYLSPKELSLRSLLRIFSKYKFDIIHLNSFFDSVFTIKLLLLVRCGFFDPRKLVLSPRGEFVEGPLRIKYFKKSFYIKLSRFFGFYKKVFWHASSKHEADGIIKAMSIPASAVHLAIDLPIKESVAIEPGVAKDGTLRVVFISRLTREKNLDGALRILSEVTRPMQFDIIGPKEDMQYWRECEALLGQVPSHVKIRYLGPISPDEVFEHLANYDLFLFPSRGENYGHVIAESLSVGTRVLTSKETPWRDLQADGVGWDFDVEDLPSFVKVLDELASQTVSERSAVRELVRKAASIRLYNREALDNNRRLYLSS